MYQLVNSGSIGNSDTADTLRVAFGKINDNFSTISSSLNFDQSIAAFGGAFAGYIVIKINGTNYKLPIYNM